MSTLFFENGQVGRLSRSNHEMQRDPIIKIKSKSNRMKGKDHHRIPVTRSSLVVMAEKASSQNRGEEDHLREARKHTGRAPKCIKTVTFGDNENCMEDLP